MIRNMLVVVILSSLALQAAADSPKAGGRESDEITTVLAAMDRYMTAISTNNLSLMAELQTSDGMTYRAHTVQAGSVEITAHPNSYWVDPARADGGTYHERYWSPVVLIRGAIAVVWAPYEFKIDGKTSHCGVDVFNFVKIDGAWKVANAMWTVEPDACAELRPADASLVRPPE